MATVFEYIIITSTRHDYRSEGTSHEDAMRNFIADPVFVTGFHSGDYETENGEQFIVIGPTQQNPSTNIIVRLVANERKSFIFKTPEQIVAEDEIERKAKRFLESAEADERVVVSARDNSTPPHDKNAQAGDIKTDHRGLWINGKRIPWSAVIGVDYADAGS